MKTAPVSHRLGTTSAIAAFVFWGLAPIYFKWIQSVSAYEIIAHRILWSVPVLAGFLWMRDGSFFLQRLRLPLRSVRILAVSSTLVVANWLIFVWAVTHDQVLATSLGYFIGPLVNVLLGFVFLKERLTSNQTIAVAIAAAGTLYLGWFLGTAPWISLALALSWGIYALIRKMLDVGPMVGMLWETLLLTPLATLYMVSGYRNGTLFFGGNDMRLNALLALAGLVTILPLIWFNVAARVLTLTTLGFYQYISPSLTFVMAVFFFDESFTRGHAVAFCCIWFALLMISTESLARLRRHHLR